MASQGSIVLYPMSSGISGFHVITAPRDARAIFYSGLLKNGRWIRQRMMREIRKEEKFVFEKETNTKKQPTRERNVLHVSGERVEAIK